MSIMRTLTLFLMLLSSMTHAATFISRVEQVPMVELFTSQGCSSCPPASSWLGRLADHPGLWQEFVPLAFHVDYWDYIGWKDRFADPRNSSRQRLYQHFGHVSSVYTPGFVLAGQEWKGFFRGDKLALRPGPKVGRLQLELLEEQNIKVRFQPITDNIPQQLQLHVALLGFGLRTPVERGENSGKQLQENFVVLGWRNKKIDRLAGEWTLPMPTVIDTDPERQAVVAWVSEWGSPAPLQAVGGWLEDE